MSDIYGIAKSGLQAYKEGLATTGQNIANVGNESYARREAPISEVKSSTDVLQIANTAGYGVKIDGITRAFDQFIDLQMQSAASGFSFSTAQATILSQLENIVRPDQGSVSAKLNEMFSALNIVSQDPSDLAARHVAVDAGRAVVTSITTVANGIIDLRNFVAKDIENNVAEANTILDQLKNIQKELLGTSSSNRGPNDVLDKRDALLKDLSELIDISVDYKAGGVIEVTAGTSGQGHSLMSGVNISQLEVQKADGISKLFVKSTNGVGLSKVQVQAGKIAGNLAADLVLTETKSELDLLARKLTSEFNEVNGFGVDLDGEIGGKFFSLDGMKVEKQSSQNSSSQLLLSGEIEKFTGQSFELSFSSSEQNWSLTDHFGTQLGKFENFFDYDGLQFNLSGVPELGDKFEINLTEGLSENLSLQLENGRKIAASSFYLVERDPSNSSATKISLSRFDEPVLSSVPDLNDVFSEIRNSANPIDFLNNGTLGVINNTDQIENLASIKTQPKIQFGEDISNLDNSSQLVLRLNNVDRVFNLGSLAGSIDNYKVLAEYLNTGAIRSDDADQFSFSDLGLHVGGNLTTLSITSASLPNYSSYPELQSGTLGASQGILIPAQPGNADIQIFTREGVHIAGRPLSQTEINSYITHENGFSRDAEYRSDHLTNKITDTYAGASISRKTTDGNHFLTISSLGTKSSVNSNLSVGAMAGFPVTRSIMNSPLIITNDVGNVYTFQPKPGMMAGNIAESLEVEISKLGLEASASNRLEIFNLADGAINFDLVGDNASPVSISETLIGGETGSLVNLINKASDTTGIKAFVSGQGSLVLQSLKGNDIAIKNITTANNSTFSTRQIDEFGEVISTAAQVIPVTVNSGDYIIAGGQIKITAPTEVNVTSGVNNIKSQKSEFLSSFVEKKYDDENGKVSFKFDVFQNIDSSSNDETGLIGVAASSSYSFELSSDNQTQKNSVQVSPTSNTELTSKAVAGALVSELRKASPQSNFVGNSFSFDDGFPEDGSTIEFQVGDQKYFAVLNNKMSYQVQGNVVVIGDNTYSKSDALKLIVNASSFNISGPEQDRLAVGFEESSGGFRLFAAAKDGVVSGHGVRLSDSNTAAQKGIFHLDHNTAGDTKTRIVGGEFSLVQASKANFAKVIVGNSTVDLSFNPASNPKVSQSTNIAGVDISIEDTGNNNGRLVVTIDQSTADLDVGLKATNNSTTFGILTSSSQLTLGPEDFSISNHGSSRVSTTAKVESLANEVFSIDGLDGEDLIILAAGTGNVSLMGEVKSKQNDMNPRELEAKISSEDAKQIEIFDKQSGHLLGARKISDTNDFLFRGFKWEINGNVAQDDTFLVKTGTERKDDASNLMDLLSLSEISSSTGRGGYSQQYSDLVIDVGFNVRSSEQGLENSKLIYDVAADRKSRFSGVDLDTEAARLLEQQQAYQALAKVLSTAKEMVDTLLRSM